MQLVRDDAAMESIIAKVMELPDQYNAIATPVGLLVFDWRLGLLSLAPVVLAFLIMATMTGKRMAEKMRQYGNALEAMSNEAVEYVRGILVVKTFGQSVFSFKKFKATIDEYEKWVISYTKGLRLPTMFYTAAVNGVFAFLIAGGLLFTTHGVTTEFLLNLLFYIIITPVISLTLTRMMYMSESKMVVADALARIDSVLEAAPMQVQAVPQRLRQSGDSDFPAWQGWCGRSLRSHTAPEVRQRSRRRLRLRQRPRQPVPAQDRRCPHRCGSPVHRPHRGRVPAHS